MLVTHVIRPLRRTSDEDYHLSMVSGSTRNENTTARLPGGGSFYSLGVEYLGAARFGLGSV